MHLRRRAISIEASKKYRGRRSADRGRVLSDDRDPRLEEVREQKVVESHQRHPSVQVQGAQRPKSTDGDEVLAGDDRGRTLRPCKDFPRGCFGLLDSSQVEPYQRRVDANLLLGKLFDVTLVALGRGRDGAHIAQVCDSPVALLDEVPDRTADARCVVRHDRVGVQE